MSRTFSTNSGSVESFQCSTRWGCRPNARHTRETVDCETPVTAAICRVDQCVPPSGGLQDNARTITSSTRSSATVRGAPGRGSSTRPSDRSATNRDRHFPTVAPLRPRRSATSLLLTPVAHSKTIRDRNANACAVFPRRAHLSNCSRSLSVSVRTAFGRPRAAIIKEYYHIYHKLLTQDTRSRGPAAVDQSDARGRDRRPDAIYGLSRADEVPVRHGRPAVVSNASPAQRASPFMPRRSAALSARVNASAAAACAPRRRSRHPAW